LAPDNNRSFLDPAVLARLSRLTTSARYPMLGSITGLHKSATRGSSVEFAEYRKYVPGDDIKHVDWSVYARTDRFYMKEFEADTNLRCYLVLDVSGSMGYGDRRGSKFEYAKRLAATLGYLLSEQGDAVGLFCFSDRIVHDIPPRRSPAHLRNIFNTLADLKPAGKTQIVEKMHLLAEKIRPRALVVMLSDFFADVPDLLSGFQHLRFHKHDVVAFHMLDRTEIDFEFDRPIRFADLESSFSMVTDPAVIRSGYRAELDRYLESIQRGCREFDIDYQRVVTDVDYEKVLASFMLQRMGGLAGKGARR